MKGIQVLDRPASQSFYAVAGRLLFIQSFDRHLAALIERLFAGWQLTPVSSPQRSPDANIVFFRGKHLPEIPSAPGLSQFDVANDGRLYAAADFYYLRFENSLLHLEPRAASDIVDIAVWVKQIPGPTEAELARITSFAVCAALRRFGLFELHSSGVVLPQSNDGLLIVGPSGSGKSTLTLQLAKAGWGYLSDDELLLSVAGEEVEARGFRSFFALAPTAAATADGPGRLKTCFEPASVLATPAVLHVVPRFVLFASVSGANETRLSELGQAETMTRLLRACPWATYDTAVAGPHLQLLSRLARQAKGFELQAGTDILEPEQASRIIRAACHA
jgi:hypothetical protein